MSSGNVGIFVATMTGLAQICAEEIQGALRASGKTSDLLLMDGLGTSALDPYETFVIVSSTYGQGDIPDNGQAFFAALQAGCNLQGKRFAVFGLGDRTYADTFCAAASKWSETLLACGATLLIDVQRHDACAGTLAEDVAGQWAASWIATL
jgi:MioC protein